MENHGQMTKKKKKEKVPTTEKFRRISPAVPILL